MPASVKTPPFFAFVFSDKLAQHFNAACKRICDDTLLINNTPTNQHSFLIHQGKACENQDVDTTKNGNTLPSSLPEIIGKTYFGRYLHYLSEDPNTPDTVTNGTKWGLEQQRLERVVFCGNEYPLIRALLLVGIWESLQFLRETILFAMKRFVNIRKEISWLISTVLSLYPLFGFKG